jgi:putative tryptophan/tyrosine transport system substrate-binding protein
MRRREFSLGVAIAGAMPTLAVSQASKVWRIGFISGATREAVFGSGLARAFVEGMLQLGYAEGKDYAIEWRFADGRYDTFSSLAKGLVESKVDVLVTGTPAAVRPIQEATHTIPIVMAYSTDPVGNGLVTSLANPGGNTTGLASSLDLSVAKQMELIAAVVPRLSRIGVLSNPQNPQTSALTTARSSARAMGLQLIPVAATDPHELAEAFSTLVNEQAGAVIVLSDAFFNSERDRIAQLALSNKVPTIFSQRQYVADGGLMSYGQPLEDFFRRATVYIDKLIKGMNPRDLPVEQPTRFFLVINLKTANALGLDISLSLQQRADEIIE